MSNEQRRQGRYFEDFTVGDIYEHWPGRTVLAADNLWFSLLTQNNNPLHIDANYASQTEFGRPLVEGAFALALVTGQSVADISMNALANLGWDEVRTPNPFSMVIRCIRAVRFLKSLNPNRGRTLESSA